MLLYYKNNQLPEVSSYIVSKILLTVLQDTRYKKVYIVLACSIEYYTCNIKVYIYTANKQGFKYKLKIPVKVSLLFVG